MHCPFCGAPDTKVIDSRLVTESNQVRRRRECAFCHERVTSYETADLHLPKIIKQDGRREPFKEEKLRSGLQRALEKRPVSAEKIEAILDQIKSDLRSRGERELSSTLVGEIVMNVLQPLDGVAYVRFASVYRSFQDLGEFKEEIERLQRQKSHPLNEDALS